MSKSKQSRGGFFLLTALVIGGCVYSLEFGDRSAEPVKSPAVAHVPPVSTGAKGPPVISVPEAQAPDSKSQTSDTDPALKNWVRAKLAELDAFKSTPEFVRFGFGSGGPYNKWLTEMEFARSDPELKRFSAADRIAVGDLLGLSMAYVSSKGDETKYTAFTRQAILDAIR